MNKYEGFAASKAHDSSSVQNQSVLLQGQLITEDCPQTVTVLVLQ